MSHTTLALMTLVLVPAVMIGGAARLALAGRRARRAEWELDRALWQRAMHRP